MFAMRPDDVITLQFFRKDLLNVETVEKIFNFLKLPFNLITI